LSLFAFVYAVTEERSNMEERMKLDEEAVEECLNVDSNTPVVLQITDSEVVSLHGCAS
jgi:hypothetical protein